MSSRSRPANVHERTIINCSTCRADFEEDNILWYRERSRSSAEIELLKDIAYPFTDTSTNNETIFTGNVLDDILRDINTVVSIDHYSSAVDRLKHFLQSNAFRTGLTPLQKLSEIVRFYGVVTAYTDKKFSTAIGFTGTEIGAIRRGHVKNDQSFESYFHRQPNMVLPSDRTELHFAANEYGQTLGIFFVFETDLTRKSSDGKDVYAGKYHIYSATREPPVLEARRDSVFSADPSLRGRPPSTSSRPFEVLVRRIGYIPSYDANSIVHNHHSVCIKDYDVQQSGCWAYRCFWVPDTST